MLAIVLHLGQQAEALLVARAGRDSSALIQRVDELPQAAEVDAVEPQQ